MGRFTKAVQSLGGDDIISADKMPVEGIDMTQRLFADSSKRFEEDLEVRIMVNGKYVTNEELEKIKEDERKEAMKKYMPIGSIVALSDDGKNEKMIIGYKVNDNGKTYDYLACDYPFGINDEHKTSCFDHSNIKRIYYVGYIDGYGKHIRSYLDYKEEIREETESKKISDIYFLNKDGAIVNIHKYNNYFYHELSYLVFKSAVEISKNIKDCCNKTIDYLESIFDPDKAGGYFDEEEEIYYYSLTKNNLKIVVESDEGLRHLKVILKDPTPETEKQFDKIAIDISNIIAEIPENN